MKINDIINLTNHEFSIKIKVFNNLCEKASVKPSKRQASKYRNRRGKAFQAKERSKYGY